MSAPKGLILLDRDGVLNRVVVDPEHGTINSPLHPSQVEIFPWVPSALRTLDQAGYGLAIVSNQPASAKGTTTKKNLDLVHALVLEKIQADGARILSSHICFHKQEDRCDCRKPKTGLLVAAFAANPQHPRERSWMVGDGVTDVEAGAAMGLSTAFLGPRKCDACKVFDERRLNPVFWGTNLQEFVEYLTKGNMP